jgi:hypothetical protein
MRGAEFCSAFHQMKFEARKWDEHINNRSLIVDIVPEAPAEAGPPRQTPGNIRELNHPDSYRTSLRLVVNLPRGALWPLRIRVLVVFGDGRFSRWFRTLVCKSIEKPRHPPQAHAAHAKR